MEIKTLITENGTDEISIGKIAFWICFFISMYFWFYLPTTAFPESLYQILEITLFYSLARTGIDTFKNIKLKEFVNKQKGVLNPDGSPKLADISYDDK